MNHTQQRSYGTNSTSGFLQATPKVSTIPFYDPKWINRSLRNFEDENDNPQIQDKRSFSFNDTLDLFQVVVYEIDESPDGRDGQVTAIEPWNREWCLSFVAAIIYLVLLVLGILIIAIPAVLAIIFITFLILASIFLQLIFWGTEFLTGKGRRLLLLCLVGAVACTGILCFTGYQDDLVDIHNKQLTDEIYEHVSILTLTMGALNDLISFLLYFFFIFTSRSFDSSEFKLTKKDAIPSYLWPLPIRWSMAPNITEPANENTGHAEYPFSSSNFIAQKIFKKSDWCSQKLGLIYSKDVKYFSTRFPTQVIFSFRLLLCSALGAFLGHNYAKSNFTNTIDFSLTGEFACDLVYMLCWGILTSVVIGHYIGCLSAISLNIKKNSEVSLNPIKNRLERLKNDPSANKTTLFPDWCTEISNLRTKWQENCEEVKFYNILTQRNMALPLVICISTFVFSVVYLVSRITVKATLDSSTIVLFCTNLLYVFSVLWMFKEAADITHALEGWGGDIKKSAREMVVLNIVPKEELASYNTIQAELDIDIQDSGMKILGSRIGRKVVWFMILDCVAQAVGIIVSVEQFIVKS